jgi:hypothetical protein
MNNSKQKPTNAVLIHDSTNGRFCCELIIVTNKHNPNHQKKGSVLRDARNKQSNAITKKEVINLLLDAMPLTFSVKDIAVQK